MLEVCSESGACIPGPSPTGPCSSTCSRESVRDMIIIACLQRYPKLCAEPHCHREGEVISYSEVLAHPVEDASARLACTKPWGRYSTHGERRTGGSFLTVWRQNAPQRHSMRGLRYRARGSGLQWAASLALTRAVGPSNSRTHLGLARSSPALPRHALLKRR